MANDVYTEGSETGLTFSEQVGDAADAPPRPNPAADIPRDFGYEDEHPQLKLPFTLHVDGRRYDGDAISVTHIQTETDERGTLALARATLPCCISPLRISL